MNANELAQTLIRMTVDGNGYKKQAIAISVCDIEKIATMLRQQQAREDSLCSMVKEYQDKVDELRNEIESLKAEIVSIEKNSDYWADKNNWIKNNEPVAELVLEQMAVGDASRLRIKWLMDGYPPVGTKLYTHPVQKPMMVLDGNRVYPAFKELTYADGIEECAQRAEAYAYMSPNFTALAEELRAILRKAQEK